MICRLLICFFLLAPIVQAAPNAPKVFRVRLSEDLGTLDWNFGEVNPEIIYQISEGLFRTNTRGQPELAAARSFKWNETKTKVVIFLKPERRWSDGSPLCAQQFVDSWNRLRSKEFASPYAHYANVLRSYEAKSCRELHISFQRAAPEALALLSHYVFFPIRLDQLERVPKIFTEGVGLFLNGPFRVLEWKRNETLTLEANPTYAGAKPELSRVEFLFIPEDSTAKTLFDQKNIDWLRDIPPLLRLPALERSVEFRVYPSLTAYYFGLNAGKSSLLNDPEIRTALSQALDRSEIPKVLGRENRGIESWLLRELFPSLKAPVKGVFLAGAKKKLLEAEKLKKMDLVLRIYNKGAHKLLAEWAQGQWEKKLGVRIPIEVQEGKVYWKEISSNPAAIFLGGVTAPFAHPRAFLQEFLTSSTANWTGWSSYAYDRAVEDEKFQDAEDLLKQNGFVIPLYQRDTVALVQKKWRGFQMNPLGQVFLSSVR